MINESIEGLNLKVIGFTPDPFPLTNGNQRKLALYGLLAVNPLDFHFPAIKFTDLAGSRSRN